ncbi:DUF4198 domain-containing protein [Hymenobacter cheonanensis]|uniref:DUF4198 domain-containing protein n=1 Tax=Hymenobacter sp. CA2-7 TaxID=3063993 RepID=UPI002713A4C6|nr:DUF4198 domain-containing protein [Hymenobacter sp. CA2-7]MDO7886544.1 DUF4198 domain-containing protein [Hymenobacter sp. CA2-7]
MLTTAGLAHEFWLQPASFRVAVGAPVPLALLVGENFGGQPWARPTRRVRRFVCFGPGATADSTDLRPALLTDSLAPTLRCATPGTHLLALTSQLASIELPAQAFTAYLREEGLGEALRQRQEAGEAATKPGREAYRRCAKSLVLATLGPHLPPAMADTAFGRVLGLPLELVPEQNPYRLRPGAALTVRVLRQGQPVPGALVQVWQASPPAAKPTAALPVTHFTTHTNAQGRLLLRVPGPGPYLLATVRIENAPAALAARADWLSTWASLTFGGPAAPAKAY